MQTVVGRLPFHDQHAFLDLPKEQRDAVVEQWSIRTRALQRFTVAERALIATLSRADADRFFALAPDKQEQFLVGIVERNTRALANYAMHRRGS